MNMKRILVLAMISVSFYVFSDNTSDSRPATDEKVYTGDVNKDGVNSFLTSCIGMDISVTISNVDNTITGKLISVYKDGIYLKTPFNNYVYIMKNSISYYKITAFSNKK